jgi:hypothetical protein
MHFLGREDLVAPFNHDLPIGEQAGQNPAPRRAVGRKYDFAGNTGFERYGAWYDCGLTGQSRPCGLIRHLRSSREVEGGDDRQHRQAKVEPAGSPKMIVRDRKPFDLF